MGMSNRKEFEDALRQQRPQADIDWSPAHGEYTVSGIQLKWEGWQVRQPEIDALKLALDGADIENKCLRVEIDALKAEVKRYKELWEGAA